MAHPVLIVDDSGFMRNIVKQILAVDEELEVGHLSAAQRIRLRGTGTTVEG